MKQSKKGPELRARVVQCLRKHPAWSDRRIAKETAVSHPTVGKIRRTVGKTTEGRVLGVDGIRRSVPHKPWPPLVDMWRAAAQFEEALDRLKGQLSRTNEKDSRIPFGEARKEAIKIVRDINPGPAK